MHIYIVFIFIFIFLFYRRVIIIYFAQVQFLHVTYSNYINKMTRNDHFSRNDRNLKGVLTSDLLLSLGHLSSSLVTTNIIGEDSEVL